MDRSCSVANAERPRNARSLWLCSMPVHLPDLNKNPVKLTPWPRASSAWRLGVGAREISNSCKCNTEATSSVSELCRHPAAVFPEPMLLCSLQVRLRDFFSHTGSEKELLWDAGRVVMKARV